MTEKQIKRIHLIYGIITTLLIIALGVWAIASCIMLYNGSESERFLPEKILPYLIAFSIPLAVCIAAIIIGAVLHAVFHVDEEKPKAFVSDKDILKNLYKKVDLSEAPEVYTKVIKSQRGFRHAFFVILLANIVINVVSCIFYIFTEPTLKAQLELFKVGNGSFPYWSLPAETNLEFTVFFPIICTILAYAVIPFFVAIVYDVFAKFTYEKELEAVKAIFASNAKKSAPVSEFDEEEDLVQEQITSASKGEGEFAHDIKTNGVKIVKYSVLVVSILFIVLGITNGLLDGTLSYVLTNAIKICFGCVGLG